MNKIYLIATLALNFYRYKTFAVFKSVTFENFQIKINTFWAFSENFKRDTLESGKNCVTFENFLIFMENAIGITPNTFHDFQKNFKSDTFANYKSFVPVEAQGHTHLTHYCVWILCSTSYIGSWYKCIDMLFMQMKLLKFWI